MNRYKLPGWTREPILWIAGVLAAANGVVETLQGDFVSLEALLKTLAILGGAAFGRRQVSPVPK